MYVYIIHYSLFYETSVYDVYHPLIACKYFPWFLRETHGQLRVTFPLWLMYQTIKKQVH